MGKVIQFEERAVANLRARLGAAEEANQDLIAFARGHSGAVSSIHAAVLAAIDAESVEQMLEVVTQDWPLILGIDAVALSLIVGDKGFRADGDGVQVVDPKILRRAIGQVNGVVMRTVERGHPIVRPGVRPDPRRGADPDRLRAAASGRAVGARAAQSAQPRCPARVGIADVPWNQPCGYDPPVADSSADLNASPARELAARWAGHLQNDRRRSPHTVRAYVATAHRLIDFLAAYRGELIGSTELRTLGATDLRAFLAHRRGAGPWRLVGGPRIVRSPRLPSLCRRSGRPGGRAAAHAGAEAAAHSAKARFA